MLDSHETDAIPPPERDGGEEYVLVFNGDLIDRGPQSDRVVEMVARLVDEAPRGHVRVTVGNHEMGVLTPDLYGWSNWYAGQRSRSERRAFIEQIQDGHVVAAYEGYNVTYAHAGQPDPYDVEAVNETLAEGSRQLLTELGAPDPFDRQAAVVEQYPLVFGYGSESSRGPDAGITWLDFEHMPEDAPPQVVGHTRHSVPVRRGNVVCQNVIRENRRTEGGEAVVVETPDAVTALARTADGGVEERPFSLPVLDGQ